MKNIIDICKDFGLEIPADKHADFLKAVNGEYKTIAEHNKVLDKLSTATKRAETAEETLKGFEGKDFETITRERDEWKRKHDENEEKYRREQEDREYNEDLEQAAKDAKCRDLKGASAHLDHENLRKSRNRKADMKTAFDALRTENGYLFDDNGGVPAFTKPGNTTPPGEKTVKEIMSIKDPVERQAQIVQNMHLFTKG